VIISFSRRTLFYGVIIVVVVVVVVIIIIINVKLLAPACTLHNLCSKLAGRSGF
jgi:cell division protein FtsL